MTIAVNAVVPAYKPAASNFLQTVFLKLAAAQPDHSFILIGFPGKAGNVPKNCTLLETGKTIKSPLLFSYWLNYQLPSLLKKNKADVLVSNNCCSLRLKLPQLLFIDDLAFLQHPEMYKPGWLNFYKKNTDKFLHKATATICTSAFLKKEIEEYYTITGSNISTLYAAASEIFKPAAHWNEKERMKEKLTAGKEYFLFTGAIYTQNNLISLLKAFSFFKQRQKSNMMLVLASTAAAETAFLKSLASYKYRTDVVVAENISEAELAEITGTAYAVVSPVEYDAAGTGVLQALQCSTPVIVSGTAAMPEICGEAAAYCHAADFNDIAAKMMLLFTNEDRRNLLIAKGRDHIQRFDIQHSAKQLWQTMDQLVKA